MISKKNYGVEQVIIEVLQYNIIKRKSSRYAKTSEKYSNTDRIRSLVE